MTDRTDDAMELQRLRADLERMTLERDEFATRVIHLQAALADVTRRAEEAEGKVRQSWAPMNVLVSTQGEGTVANALPEVDELLAVGCIPVIDDERNPEEGDQAGVTDDR